MSNVSYGLNKCPNCKSTNVSVSTGGLCSACGRKVKPMGGLSQSEWRKFTHASADEEMEMRRRMRDPVALRVLRERGLA